LFTVNEALFYTQECYVPAELLVGEDQAEQPEPLSSEEEEIIEKTTEVGHLLELSTSATLTTFVFAFD